jgi:hypothetical protein
MIKTKNKSEKNDEKNFISGESDDEGAFIVLKFIFSKRVQFRTFIYSVVENSTGYPKISLLFQKY